MANNCLNQNSQNFQDYQNSVRDELTYKVIGCAMQVHRALGNGFQEVIYQRSLAVELGDSGVFFEREKEQTVYYKNVEVGTRRADFIIEGSLAQAKNYLEAYNFQTGLLINFGSKSLEYKLIFNKKHRFHQTK